MPRRKKKSRAKKPRKLTAAQKRARKLARRSKFRRYGRALRTIYRKRAAARKERREQDKQHYAADESAWRRAFAARHGYAPSSVDWMTDYNYTWRDRYAASTARSTPAYVAPSRNERLVEKLRRLANDPGATVHERDNARRRITELS